MAVTPRPSDLPAWMNPAALGRALTLWAHFPRPFSPKQSKREYPFAVERLKEIALEETWHFSDHAPSDNPFPILWNYLAYTFVRLSKQDIILGLPSELANLRTSADGRWATFNTGLVDRLYEPVFALVKKHSGGAQPWCLYDFCVPGQDHAGLQLTEVFEPLPEPPKYFTSSFDMLLDTEKPLNIRGHVTVDGIKRDRFPYEFVRQNLQPSPPKGLAWEDYSSYEPPRRRAYLESLGEAVKDDARAQRNMKNQLEHARNLALKRTKWNFKTAIPQYYPRDNEMSLLLPLCLVNDEVVDVALVVSRQESGAYLASTVYPLDWAYQNARLVCRPDSDWLVPENITEGT